ncbi:hypothetical protein BT93_L2409 [Corymbia citriodora subsp. variegata]|uniref:Pentatricopeptide repeat-containing protein n=1 Tax=Corymbia citriodora subsp. variegata TaxID=360336 RepID=A0A8T0CL48_CORYI|nr:hypothetical protein BT93_L2409 [Corymbia citriodora subsp. variegata]
MHLYTVDNERGMTSKRQRASNSEQATGRDATRPTLSLKFNENPKIHEIPIQWWVARPRPSSLRARDLNGKLFFARFHGFRDAPNRKGPTCLLRSASEFQSFTPPINSAECSRSVSSDSGVSTCLARVGDSLERSLNWKRDNVNPGWRRCSNGSCDGSIGRARTPSTSFGSRAGSMRTRGFATSNTEDVDLVSMSNVRRPDQEVASDPSELAPPVYSEADVEVVCALLLGSEDWDSAREALEKCSVNFTSELVLEIIRRCKFRSGTALRFFDWVGKRDGYGHNTEAYNMAMKIAGGAKDFERMRSLFYEMRRKGCLITPHTWTIMIMQYGRTGLTEIALRIFDEMKASGCELSGSTYKWLIISLCGRKGRKVDEAVKLFREMMKSKYVPDKEFVEIYLGCLCESDKLLDARKCVNFLSEVGFSTALSYSLYIRALCRAGNLEEAVKLLNNAGAERETLNKYVYGSIVHGLLRKGNLEVALSKVDKMKEAGVSPSVHVYTSLVVHYLKEKEIEKAKEVLETMKRTNRSRFADRNNGTTDDSVYYYRIREQPYVDL